MDRNPWVESFSRDHIKDHLPSPRINRSLCNTFQSGWSILSTHSLLMLLLTLCLVTVPVVGQFGPYSQYASGTTLPKSPADSNRYHHSDQRCLDDIKAMNHEENVQVQTFYGRVTGVISFLCDSPGLPERDRPPGSTYPPSNSNFNPSSSSSTYHSYNQYSQIRPRVRNNVTIFLGVPYARPPTKEFNLRFKQPQPPLNWGSIDTKNFKPSCPQPLKYTGGQKMISQVDEDCLYLNIYTPYAANKINTKYPVMVHVHGGQFEHGSGNQFPGHMLSASQQVVVVTFNYRLGLLGFFATADNASAGNYGMMDQVRALHFVRENIHNFNGDPEKVTLFGPGAGAASSLMLSLSPMSRHMVHRAIGWGGSALSPWATNPNHLLIKNNSIIAGFSFGCTAYNSYKVVECLNSRSFGDIGLNQVKPDVGWNIWSPVPDFATRPQDLQFMPVTPEDMLSSTTTFPPFPRGFAYLTGVARDEGSNLMLEDEDFIRRGFEADGGFFEQKIEQFIRIYNATLNPDAFKEAIRFMYSPSYDKKNTTLIREGLVRMFGDGYYVSGVDRLVKKLLHHGIPTYMYVLNYTLDGLSQPEWRAIPHNSESLLASGAPFMDSRFYPKERNLERAKWTEADRNMSQFFMESWANFAKFGNPTPQALFNTILWKPMEHHSLQFLSLNTTNYTSVMHRDYRQKECQFWNDYLPNLSMSVPHIWVHPFEPLEVELRIYRAATWAVVSSLIFLLFLTILCSCLYCRAKRERWGDAAIDDYLPNIDKLSVQYSAPSTRANSESSLRSLSRSRDRVDFSQLKSPSKGASAKYSTRERGTPEIQPLNASTPINGRPSNAVVSTHPRSPRVRPKSGVPSTRMQHLSQQRRPYSPAQSHQSRH